MQVTSEKSVTVQLVLTEPEANLLRSMLQNGPENEEKVFSAFRAELFNGITRALRSTPL